MLLVTVIIIKVDIFVLLCVITSVSVYGFLSEPGTVDIPSKTIFNFGNHSPSSV